MRVAIIGGTGFIGRHLVEALLERQCRPVVLARPGSEGKVRRSVEIVSGDVGAIGDLIKLLSNCDAAIYNIGILREDRARGVTFEALQYDGVLRALDAARACRVPRFLLMSALGAKRDGTPYQDTKYRAERAAMLSQLDVTVFRPSVVFGNPAGASEFATQLRDDMVTARSPAIGFFNAFGPHRGQVLLSPVHVRDVADAFVSALFNTGTIGKTLSLAGPETLSWRTIVQRLCEVASRSRWILPIPLQAMMVPALLFGRFSWFPVTADQLRMLAEGSVATPAELEALIEREPRTFANDNLAYLAHRTAAPEGAGQPSSMPQQSLGKR